MSVAQERLVRALVVLLVAVASQRASEAIKFNVTLFSKCLGEEIQEGTLVVGTYQVLKTDPLGKKIEHPGTITVKVTSPNGNQLHFHDDVDEGHFGFTTKETGQYMACFWLPVDHPTDVHSVQVELEWKIGVAAKDWSKIAKKDKLDGIGLELRKLDEAVKSIREEMTFFRKRESEMRDLNEVTNSRVAWLSVVSLLVCVGLAALQLWHLKSYFERKKLL
eukprot:TRINITY_DN3245_c0_g2_i2.p1 TRINITY_DN3245_c0_g2~~TRINITY_DN3245_c0_g2_i2.p1  ORF type:complete len:220 (-),score=25.73 TRINITY_DN3245_c0_g2_i2:119-778(-)